MAPLLKTLGSDSSRLNEDELRKTVEFAERLYGERTHWTGVPLLDHTIGVLSVLLPFHPDEETVQACLLQHVLKTRKISLPELEEEFGPGVRGIVSSVHLLSHVTMRNRKSSIEDLRLMLLSVSDDVRVLLIILCDRCYVLQHLQDVPLMEARRTCRDVLGLFAPVAARLGIHSLKQRLESLAFPIVHAGESEKISEQLGNLQARHGSFLEIAASSLVEALREQGIAATVQGREKLPYSIFMKMKSKSISHIESLPDLYALRVVVNSEEDCYRVLGVLHRLGRPVANRFKDYIAFPKPNGYQSLHTTVARLPGVPDGVFMEVQVRTSGMHREAEFGIAAHWSYKEGGGAQRILQRVRLQQVLTTQQAVEGAEGVAPSLVDHIFVLTPKGDIVELPEGATPLDFAFQIHTDLGLTFRAARVNGSIVSLEYELENGDVVEILSHRVPKPSPEWLQLLKMASSRSRLRRYLHSIDRTEYVNLGRDLFNEELHRRRLAPLDTDLSLLRRRHGKYLSFEEREDLLMKIGQGADKASATLMHLDLVRDRPRLPPSVPRKSARDVCQDVPFEADGGVPLPLRIAKCCSPEKSLKPEIVGVITRAGYVMVHHRDCRMVQHGNPERRIGVRWR